MLLNITRSKGGQTMKFGQFRGHAEIEAGRLVPGLFLYFTKALHEVKARGLQLSFCFDSPQLGIQ